MDVLAKVSAQFRALETGDAELARTAVGADWVDHEAHFARELGELRGPACLLAVGVWLRTGVPDLTFVEKATVADERHAISYVLFTGTHTGPFVRYRDGRLAGVIPPTGARLEIRQTHIHDLREGEIVTHRAVRDDLTMLNRLGVLPPSPAGLARTIAWRLDGRARRAAAELVEAQRAAATGSS